VPLDDGDLAYMRETQAEHRPTAATFQSRTEVSDGMGGTTTSAGEPQPIQVRVAPAEDIPEVAADRYGLGVVSITLDLVTVTAGDTITVSAQEAYEVVSDGAIGEWTTAQQVLAVRTAWPPQGA
jgi:hypothetical protein